MKQIVILSGKGGTGKTTLTAALAHLASREMSLVLADADVDAANLELLLSPDQLEEYEFIGGYKARILQERCTGCSICLEVCRFGAVVISRNPGEHYSIDSISCEGCNSCLHQCPENAIESSRNLAGTWFRSSSSYGPLFHAAMKAGEENSGKLVSTVKKAAENEGGTLGSDLLMVDGPPGIGCPVIAACAGADLALISTEPGVSAIHDLRRILLTVDHFGIKPAVCVNKSDINSSRTLEIENFCSSEDIPLLGRVPYDSTVTRAMARGFPVTEFDPDCPASVAATRIWNKLVSLL